MCASLATPNISTMVDGCRQIHGAKCVRFNHEVSPAIMSSQYIGAKLLTIFPVVPDVSHFNRGNGYWGQIEM
jgi:hypothetical protein